MTVKLSPGEYCKDWERDALRARKMVENILLSFHGRHCHAVGMDGSKRRLLYEIAVNCDGPHHPIQSRSKAVLQRLVDQRDLSNEKCQFMTVLEFPCKIHNENESHWDFLCKPDLINKIDKETNCEHKVGCLGMKETLY